MSFLNWGFRFVYSAKIGGVCFIADWRIHLCKVAFLAFTLFII